MTKIMENTLLPTAYTRESYTGIIFVSCILSIERKKPLNHNLLIGAGSLNKYKNNTWATKKTFLLSIIITGCFIGILRMIYDIYNPQSPRNWVVFPPLYTPNKQEPFFFAQFSLQAMATAFVIRVYNPSPVLQSYFFHLTFEPEVWVKQKVIIRVQYKGAKKNTGVLS